MRPARGDMCSLKVLLLLLVCIILGPCHTQQVGAETRPAQPEGLLSGLGRLVQSFALDVGTHTAHLLLNGLPPEDLGTSKPAGPLSKGGETTAEDVHFSTRDDTLKLAQDNMHADFCQRQYPTSKGMYISNEPCTLAHTAVCE